MPRRTLFAALALAIISLTAPPFSFSGTGTSVRDATGKAAGRPGARTPRARPDPLAGVDLGMMVLANGGYGETLADGRRVFFTLIPDLQRFADDLLADNEVPTGAAVVLDAVTGRVLAMAQHRERPVAHGTPDVALDPSPPVASVFKIVTAAALLERGLTVNEEACYHGGSHRLYASNLADAPGDTLCASMAAALGHSINAVFAKLSDRHLTRGAIQAYAEAFGFNRDIPFDVPVPRSKAEIPDDRLERARAAAGFWHSSMSPLHAAMIAQAVANGGAMQRPFIVDRVEDARGKVLHKGAPRLMGRSIREGTSRNLLGAMVETVESGTARKAFRDGRGRPYLPGVSVSGKTGTLNGSDPFRAYSWFVAAAPAQKPEVAVAVLVVNDSAWRIKAAGAAAQILKRYFEKGAAKGKAEKP
ncbi:MAG: penicillin-binding transpeptidase domain-containing protein [Deltaproteobacteria bacterium]|nr:penicillin-binding transpeptidase domain-containing protein [Deltaproteobacteria bacterium]